MLNLEKIKAFTAPKKTNKYFIAGEFQEVEINVIPDNAMMVISQMDFKTEQMEIVSFALQHILKINKTDIDFLLENDFAAAMEIFNDGKDISVEWAEKRAKERENAKKNLKTVQINTQS